MNSPTDFMLEKYKADRAHELELNKIQGTLEATALFGLVLLNGAAIVSYLSFLGNVWDKPRVPNMTWSRCAVLFWGVGVFLGALTALFGLWCQSAFARAYRNRRLAEEWRRAAEAGLNCDRARERLGLGADVNEKTLNEEANRQRENGGLWQKWSRRAAICGLLAFLLGVAFGFLAIEGAAPPGRVSADVQTVGSTEVFGPVRSYGWRDERPGGSVSGFPRVNLVHSLGGGGDMLVEVSAR